MKYFGLAAAALMMTISASAATITVTCSVAGTNGANNFASAALNCAQLTAVQLGGNTLNSVEIQISDSFNQGNPATNPNIFDFNYTAIDPDVKLLNSGLPNTCLTSGTGSASTCEDIISGQITGGTFYQLGNLITTNLAAYVGSGTFAVADVGVSVDASAPNSSLTASGQLGSTAFVTYSFSAPTTGAPEPGSMMLLGSGLLVAGLIGRKKFVNK